MTNLPHLSPCEFVAVKRGTMTLDQVRDTHFLRGVKKCFDRLGVDDRLLPLFTKHVFASAVQQAQTNVDHRGQIFDRIAKIALTAIGFIGFVVSTRSALSKAHSCIFDSEAKQLSLLVDLAIVSALDMLAVSKKSFILDCYRKVTAPLTTKFTKSYSNSRKKLADKALSLYKNKKKAKAVHRKVTEAVRMFTYFQKNSTLAYMHRHLKSA